MFATLEAKVLGSIALVAVLLGAFGVYTFHERAVGKTDELAALQKSTEKLKQDTAAQTANLQARATMAEQAYAKEQLLIANLPPVQPVRLCLDTSRGAIVPAASPVKSRDEAAGATASGVQPVPTGTSSGPDIGPLLQALAARADQVSATLREFQSR